MRLKKAVHDSEPRVDLDLHISLSEFADRPISGSDPDKF